MPALEAAAPTAEVAEVAEAPKEVEVEAEVVAAEPVTVAEEVEQAQPEPVKAVEEVAAVKSRPSDPISLTVPLAQVGLDLVETKPGAAPVAEPQQPVQLGRTPRRPKAVPEEPLQQVETRDK